MQAHDILDFWFTELTDKHSESLMIHEQALVLFAQPGMETR